MKGRVLHVNMRQYYMLMTLKRLGFITIGAMSTEYDEAGKLWITVWKK